MAGRDDGAAARREHFERLVERAERLVAASPRAYKLRLALLAALGYGVVFGLLFTLVALVAGSLWAAVSSTVFLILLIKQKLVIVLGLLVFTLVRALWVRFEAPQGYLLTRQRCPTLYAEVDSLAGALGAPRIHRIVLGEDFNAAIAQTPRLGIFGWPRNTLILGLPLLLALSPEQARAVLAHEFGHLSGRHCRFNGWIYRVRVTWDRVMQAFDHSSGFGAGLLRRFFDWYAPSFSAYSFALARANEYEADAIAARLASPAAAAAALARTAVLAPAAQQAYWAPLVARAEHEPEPESSPYAGLARFFAAPPLDEAALADRLASALRVETGHGDTHPALADRLDALDLAVPALDTPATSAAAAWLGATCAAVIADFDQAWLAQNAAAWRQRYAQASEARATLAAIDARAVDTLADGELWQRAALNEHFAAGRDALPLYRDYQARCPGDRDADFAIGRLLLERDDEAGLAALERATDKLELVQPACELAWNYLVERGRKSAARAWRDRAERHADLVQAATLERQAVARDDRLKPPDLSDEARAFLRERLTALDGLQHAWLCEKVVEHLPERPVYVLAFQVRGWRKREQAWYERINAAVDWPADTFFVMKGGSAGALVRRVAATGVQVV
ncbi:MAG: M48 family metalloprotease [Gammaproteobacteria bacterium]|nr:M48 family metalloprotease [Gammaproteobacteria bacterium]